MASGSTEASTHGDDLGEVDFQVTCAADVQADFDRAVALLHHMMYQQARAEFQAIAAQEPGCAMAHWGIATSLFQPLWPGRPDLETRTRGWEAVERAGELGPGNERERLLLDATAAFWENPDEDEWWPRIQRWAEAMEGAHGERPDDLEIAAFHGLAVLAAGQVAEDQLAENARAAEILYSVHREEPLHPGAIHYIIHADDATGRAEEHLHVVERYGEVAPHVPHALHMPSHIYVRLGDWPEVIQWNRRSAEAALDHPTDGKVSFHYIHAMDYKLYGHLQRGEDARADEILRRSLVTGPYQEDFASAFHLAVMPARVALERRDWDEAARIRVGNPDYLDWARYEWPQALSWFARGMGAVMTGDMEAAQAAEGELMHLRDRAEAAGEDAYRTYIEVDRLILSGRIAWAAGDDEGALALTREAAELEGTVQKHPITPGALLPPYEALGELLQDMDRPAEALEAFEAGLEVWPKRYRSLLGAATAAEAAGLDEEARIHFATLQEVVNPESERRPFGS
ncbi:MAG: hypothetical protein EA422_00350 [Gemmatimonadales bacterium]|nr:MAG: hypothetical protein EA422_00350 [Gemmatimonadales bacterium]